MTKIDFLNKVEKTGLKMMGSRSVWISLFSILFISTIVHVPLILNKVPGFSGDYRGISGNNAFEPWVKLTISTLGSVGILGAVGMISKLNRNFMWIGVFGNIMLSLNGALSLLWFEAGKRIFFALMYITQWCKWGKNEKLQTERINFFWIIIGVSLIGGMVGLGAGMHTIPNSSDWISKPYFDSIQTSFFLVGAILLVKKKTESHILYFVGDILAIIMFSQMQNWTLVITMSTFLMTTIPSYLQWNSAIKK